jgi:hypothetical protein
MRDEQKIAAAAVGARIARGYGVERQEAAAAGAVLLPAALPEWVEPEAERPPPPPAGPDTLSWEGCRGGAATADRLFDTLLQAARREPVSHFHLHFWISEVLRSHLDLWLAEGLAAWRPLRQLAQDSVSAGINLRQRSVDDAVETAGAYFFEPRFGPPGPAGSSDPRRVFASILFALSFGGKGLDRALTVLAAGPGDLDLVLGRFGQLAGAFYGARLGESAAAFAAHPELLATIDSPSTGPSWPPSE